MSRDESLYLADIQESCEKVLRFTKGMSYKDFVHDDLHFDAVLRNLEIIGEAVKNISEGTRQKYPKIKWRKIAGFRDIVAHEYFGIDDETAAIPVLGKYKGRFGNAFVNIAHSVVSKLR